MSAAAPAIRSVTARAVVAPILAGEEHLRRHRGGSQNRRHLRIVQNRRRIICERDPISKIGVHSLMTGSFKRLPFAGYICID
jgi:hypothetical protein